MKKFIKYTAAVAATTLAMTSCTEDNNPVVDPTMDLVKEAEAKWAALSGLDEATGAGDLTAAWAKDWAVGVDYAGTVVAQAAIDEAKANNRVLEGRYSENVTIGAGEVWVLNGGVHFDEGAMLTIGAGAIIVDERDAESEDAEVAAKAVGYILMERGSKIMAEGTAEEMIVFTSTKQERGAWGGLIINGRAPINAGDENGEAEAEISGSKYGGADAADNSGMLKFVRVEFTGNIITADKEHNGITFNGVGNQTVVENVQSHMGADDGFEWFGGTLNVSNLISTGSEDDSFDWTFGWSGKGMNLIAIQSADAGDRGIEADNNRNNNTLEAYSNPTLENVTLIGRNADGKAGFKFREGTKATVKNLLVENFQIALDVQHDVTLTNLIDGNLSVENFKAVGATTVLKFKGDE
ncbi:hypothetical protein [Algivirga pacifica]|uniref:Right handed beta helix region n=1 Tax=Algivirga pacifica TaxID=1162670 RepID=A0ABP9DLK0_9BACT